MKVINFVKFTFLYLFINKCEGNPEESNGFLPSPGRPLVMSFNSRSVNLSWTPPPPFNDGPELPLTDYSIHVRRGENSSWLDSKKLLTNNTGTTYTVQHLRPFTVYSFKVGAVFGNLTSDESSESYYMITLREVPSGTPTITVAHNTSSTSIYLAWEPPHTLTINGEFLGYKLSYESRSSNRSGKFSRTIKNPTIREFILRDLNIFTQYSISLQVLNPEGAGPATKVVVMTDEGVPSSPMYATIHSMTNVSAVVDWSRPSNPNGVIEGYRLYFLHGNFTDVKTIKSRDPRVDYVLTNLEPSTTYYVWIKAFTWKNEGLSSSKLSIKTDVSRPEQPAITNISCLSNNTISVEWNNVNREGEVCNYIFRLSDETNVNVIFVNGSRDSEYIQFQTESLAPGHTYSISVRASLASMYRAEVTYTSMWSEAVHLHLQDRCHLASPHTGSVFLADKTTGYHAVSPGVIAGIVLTMLALMSVMIGIILWSKYCKESYYYLDESGAPKSSQPCPQWDNDTHYRLTAEQFLAHVKNSHLDGDTKGFQLQSKNLLNLDKNWPNSCSYEQPVFIDGFRKSKAFYATPLPLPYKFTSFWKQVWEQKVSVIVMMENIVENGKILCDQYWPESKALYGQVEVSLQHTVKLANFTVRTFLVSNQSLSRKSDIRQLLHFQYTSWPKNSNPENPLPLLNYIRASSSHSELRGSPVIVHTSPANNRAGVYIAIAVMLKQIKSIGELNLLSFLLHSGQKGQHLIRSVKDFNFLHDTLAEAVAAGETNIKNSYLTRYINSLHSSFMTYGESRQLLDQQLALVNTAFNQRENNTKDQDQTPLAFGKTAVRWIPGFFSLQAFLLSKHPEERNVQEFWRLVLENGVNTIVAVKSDMQAPFPEIWSNMQVNGGPIYVTHRDDEISFKFKSKNFILEFGNNMRKFVKVIFCDNFLGQSDSNLDTGQALSLLETVHSRMSTLPKSPILVLDGDGGEAGTAFCALLTLYEQNIHEQHCDVYQAVKTANMSRQGAWSKPVKLMQVYKVVEEMVNKESMVKEKHLQQLQKFNKKSQFRISIRQWRTGKNIQNQTEEKRF